MEKIDLRGKKILLVTAHPDDESYLFGGLIQNAKEVNAKVDIVCLTKGGGDKKGEKIKKTRNEELKVSGKILGINKINVWDYEDGNLFKTKSSWKKKLSEFISKNKPDLLFTFDHSGISGHADHIAICVEVLKIVKSSKDIDLYWRVPDSHEKDYFSHNKHMKNSSNPTNIVKYGIVKAFRKTKSIFCHKSQMKDIKYKLHIVEWHMFNNKELYHKVNLKNKYKYRV